MLSWLLVYVSIFVGWFLYVRFVIDKEATIKFGWDYWIWAIICTLVQLFVLEFSNDVK